MKRNKSLASALAAAMLISTALMPAHATEQKTNPIMGIDAASLDWVESLFYYIMLDNRINWIFKEFGNVERQIVLNTQLEQMVLGGAVEYQGASMAAAHADLGITMAQFNAVVEAAYNACERNNISYYACNQLINALAPFTDDIVTR